MGQLIHERWALSLPRNDKGRRFDLISEAESMRLVLRGQQ